MAKVSHAPRVSGAQLAELNVASGCQASNYFVLSGFATANVITSSKVTGDIATQKHIYMR